MWPYFVDVQPCQHFHITGQASVEASKMRIAVIEAAVRELREETNLCDVPNDCNPRRHIQSYMKAGLYLDIKKNTKGAFRGRVIRVYPFALTLPRQDSNSNELLSNIEMRGTEHDMMKFVSIDEFLQLTPCVPELQMAFHHATTGAFLKVRC